LAAAAPLPAAAEPASGGSAHARSLYFPSSFTVLAPESTIAPT
jgi:hypothetical protein